MHGTRSWAISLLLPLLMTRHKTPISRSTLLSRKQLMSTRGQLPHSASNMSTQILQDKSAPHLMPGRKPKRWVATMSLTLQQKMRNWLALDTLLMIKTSREHSHRMESSLPSGPLEVSMLRASCVLNTTLGHRIKHCRKLTLKKSGQC